MLMSTSSSCCYGVDLDPRILYYLIVEQANIWSLAYRGTGDIETFAGLAEVHHHPYMLRLRSPPITGARKSYEDNELIHPLSLMKMNANPRYEKPRVVQLLYFFTLWLDERFHLAISSIPSLPFFLF